MNVNVDRLQITMQQMERLLRALEDLRETVLPDNPQLFAVLAEGPLDNLHRLRNEVGEYLGRLDVPA